MQRYLATWVERDFPKRVMHTQLAERDHRYDSRVIHKERAASTEHVDQ